MQYQFEEQNRRRADTTYSDLAHGRITLEEARIRRNASAIDMDLALGNVTLEHSRARQRDEFVGQFINSNSYQPPDRMGF